LLDKEAKIHYNFLGIIFKEASAQRWTLAIVALNLTETITSFGINIDVETRPVQEAFARAVSFVVFRVFG